MKDKMFAKGIFALNCGSLFADKGNAFTYGVDIGKRVEIPMLAFLVKSDKENLLFDAGIDQDDHEFIDPLGKDIILNKEDLLFNRLKDVGVSPEEINYVFISHLHFDHSGLLRYFKKARIFIQRQEYGYAINPPPFNMFVYRRHYYDSPALNWEMLDGDENLMPGITAISTPGHSPGHQSLMVNLAGGGTKILTGDCAYFSENIEKEIIPGVFVDPSQALHSLKKLKNLANITGGEMLYSHSPNSLH
ncbi:N-acyl homoserine lactonase family protein [Chloroflexota bacterium]